MFPGNSCLFSALFTMRRVIIRNSIDGQIECRENWTSALVVERKDPNTAGCLSIRLILSFWAINCGVSISRKTARKKRAYALGHRRSMSSMAVLDENLPLAELERAPRRCGGACSAVVGLYVALKSFVCLVGGGGKWILRRSATYRRKHRE